MSSQLFFKFISDIQAQTISIILNNAVKQNSKKKIQYNSCFQNTSVKCHPIDIFLTNLCLHNATIYNFLNILLHLRTVLGWSGHGVMVSVLDAKLVACVQFPPQPIQVSFGYSPLQSNGKTASWVFAYLTFLCSYSELELNCRSRFTCENPVLYL